MIKTAAFALTAALMSVAPAAFAEPAKTAPEPATEQTEAAPAPAARAAKPVRYCVIETFTGSRIPVKHCQTRADWLAQGFDPLAK
ncbi:hypothetical protein H5J25_06535 [Sphingomonas aliaeris]|uniref:Uncharacterized protein n=1 Tax=Sphingomonas aliaeris TaxID=2759526 RepID=A0A974NWN4_9SPHN|nr:hypothetical protein [Sphingomonas aliaeris]QQV78321.1 hypothetical protein H5J25_06535 [Sphingomonas aliaeris]